MSSVECSVKTLTSPTSCELFQRHQAFTFKLLKTVADFSQALATLHDRFGHELQVLVETFRKRNGELRKERLNGPNGVFQIWELFLQQVEVNSQQHGDISRDLGQSTGNGLIERILFRKIQSKKLFAHKERIETILIKSSELLHKCHKDYCQAYLMALKDPAQFMSDYIASHNVYVHQLQATNGMVHAYQTKTLPRLLEELEECQLDTSQSISAALLQSSRVISEKASEQASGYTNLAGACKQATGQHRSDLAQFVRLAQATKASALATGSKQQQNANELLDDERSNSVSDQQHSDNININNNNNNNNTINNDNSSSNNSNNNSNNDDGSGGGSSANNSHMPLASSFVIRYHQFQTPTTCLQQQPQTLELDSKNLQLVPTFKNEIAPDPSEPAGQQQPQLERERLELEEKIDKMEERCEQVARMLLRSNESRFFNKVNELQEELCTKKFELLVAQIHLSAVRSQLQLFEYNFRPGSAFAELGADHQLGADGGFLMAGEMQAAGQQLGGMQSLAGRDELVSISVSGGGGGSARRSPSATGALAASLGYRHKWIKAFKSLKETPTSQPKFQPDGTDMTGGGGGDPALGADQLQQQQQHTTGAGLAAVAQVIESQHCFQEYTFKKIASCDVCKDFLRGHMRQGVKCKLCKISCHNECQSKAHKTIKCQQPKIKLLRRQKSAGELEVNAASHLDGASDNALANADSERGSSSKPESIYSLIRQVLDAKKRNHDAHHHLRQPNAGYQTMNLSTGNLALANQNGKSASALQLQSGSGGCSSQGPSSVDRWSVVMDLLAQSKKKQELDSTKGSATTTTTTTTSGSKRHSKQLDKFKLAARSAAVASKYQRATQRVGLLPSGGSPSDPLVLSPSSPVGQEHASEAASDQHQSASASASVSVAAGQLARHQHHHHQQQQASANSSGPTTSDQQQQQHSSTGAAQSAAGSLLVHHTKSLPVGGKLAPVQAQAQAQAQSQQQQQILSSSLTVAAAAAGPHHYEPYYAGSHLHASGSLPMAAGSGQPPPNQQQQPSAHHAAGLHQGAHHHHHQQQQQQHHQHSTHQAHLQQQQQQQLHQQQPHVYNQLLNISGQQLQSTSAPHSPQRKRFNLRMKSFSLDSPESPSMGAAGPQSHTLPSSGGSGGGLATHQDEDRDQDQQQQQQQQQLLHHQYDHHQVPMGQHYYSTNSNHQPHQHFGAGSVFHHAAGLNSSATSSASTSEERLERAAYHTAYGQLPAYSQSQSQQQQQQHYALDQQHSYSYLAPSDAAASYAAGHQRLAPRGSTGASLTAAELSVGAPQLQQHRHSYHNPAHLSAYLGQYHNNNTNNNGNSNNNNNNSLALQQQQLLLSTQQQQHQSFGGGYLHAGHHQQHQAHFHSEQQQHEIDSRHCSSQLNIHSGGPDQDALEQRAKRLVGSSGQLVGCGGATTTTTADPSQTSQVPAAGKQKSGSDSSAPHGRSADKHETSKPHDNHTNNTNSNNNSNNHNASSGGSSSSTSKHQKASSKKKADYYDLLDSSAAIQQQDHQDGVSSRHHSPPSPLLVGAGPSSSFQTSPSGGGQLKQTQMAGSTNTFVVLYDYLAQHSDEIQLAAGQLVQVVDTSDCDWWKVCSLDGLQRLGYFPASYLVHLYSNERPLQVAQTIQVSNGETCDKLLRGQIVIHTGKQVDNFVTIRTVRPLSSQGSQGAISGAGAGGEVSGQHMINYIQCPEKYLLEIVDVQ